MLGEDSIKDADGGAGGTGSDVMGECNVEGDPGVLWDVGAVGAGSDIWGEGHT